MMPFHLQRSPPLAAPGQLQAAEGPV
jgi:hypothetical protein